MNSCGRLSTNQFIMPTNWSNLSMGLSKKLRFEVFKRDKFTCQYCGKSAPDVLLHVDHITPVSKGGKDDLLNLVTSCADCNLGKGARLLTDDTAVKKRKAQLDELQERREQLEMLLAWHRSLAELDQQVIDELAKFWDDLVPDYSLNEHGIQSLEKYLKRFEVNEILEAMRISVQQYLEYDDSDDPTKPTQESVEKAWAYVPRICSARRREKDKPYLRDLYYARGILRNRLHYVNEPMALQLMEQAVLCGITPDQIKELAKEVRNWTNFRLTMEEWIEDPESATKSDEDV